ncbi:MAG: hypothetical protein II977_07765 [Oscillospiraceae bacterium]|nr:hypothetical protein [Oscillospiraceae bacterium]
MKKLVILGFGGYGRTIEDVVLSGELFDEIVFLDDNARHTQVKGACADFRKFIAEDTWFYPAFGNNNLRVEWLNMLANAGAQLATIIHPAAYVGRNAVIEKGTAVLPKAVVNTNTTVRMGCIVNFGAVIDHDVVVEKGVHLCINSVIKASNRIPPFAKIEAGHVIHNNTYK